MKEPEGQVRQLSARQLARHEWLRRWTRLMDSAFRIPGTSLRWGWDPIVGLLPGIGDAVTPLFSCLLIIHAFNLGIPKLVQARMVVNVVLDWLVGTIPILGDIFDFAWKSNDMNLALVERHRQVVRRPGAGDWIVVVAALAVVLFCAVLPLLLATWFLHALGRSWL